MCTTDQVAIVALLQLQLCSFMCSVKTYSVANTLIISLIPMCFLQPFKVYY